MKIFYEMSDTERLDMSNKAYQKALLHQSDDKAEQFDRDLAKDLGLVRSQRVTNHKSISVEI
jgi:hypothetical protein